MADQAHETNQQLNPVGTPIKTKEHAVNALLDVVGKATLARSQCNVVFPGDNARTARFQRKAHHKFLMIYGQALGMLTAFFRVGLIDANAYSQLRQQTVNTLAPTVVGVAQ